jgi:hypothetical protein
MEIKHPSYRPEWSRGAGCLVEVYHELDKLCPGSPGHRMQFFCSVERLMDSYNLDGFYLDGGLGLARPGCSNKKHDNHVHFAEMSADEAVNADHLADDVVRGKLNEGFCALWNEFLCEIYARVVKRDGIVIAHIGSDTPSPFQDKCWDYQLLGEGISDVLKSVEKSKYYDPYVIRFLLFLIFNSPGFIMEALWVKMRIRKQSQVLSGKRNRTIGRSGGRL